MKRVLSLVLALSMVMSMFTFSFAGTSLKDVAGTEYESAVEALVELGIVNGYKDGTYLPENVVSRSEMAKLLVVAAGLAPAAELAEGTTKFSDVAADHWATGYINVAAEYGYVMGDPDGSFRPDDTVSYAEAITMALRVLGYKTVVEAKGTWPTNYIAKAEEMDLLEDITYGTYAAGAARGNVALLIWNMLRLPMWDISSESEGNGLTYEEQKYGCMLNKKFKDYRYEKTYFLATKINSDAEVLVYLAGEGWVEYAKTNFYTFVPGAEVEVLINTKDDVVLSMVATDEYKYLAGGKATIDEEYDDNKFINQVYAFAYAMIDGKDIVGMNQIDVTSTYIYDLDDSSAKRLKYNETETLRYDDFEDKKIVLKDGELASIKDIELGDVLSTLRFTSSGETVEFYMISGNELDGKLTKLVDEEFKDNSKTKYPVATIGGEEYPVATGAVYFVSDEDLEDAEELDFLGASSTTLEEMKNEEVKFVVDFLGRVTAVIFDGELNKGGEVEASEESAFYALMGPVERDGSTYSITVANEDGEQELTFAKGKGNAAWIAGTDYAGYFVLMTLNDDDEVTELSGDYNGKVFAVRADESGDSDINALKGKYVYDEEGHEFVVSGETNLRFDDNKLYRGTVDASNLVAKVDDSTVVVTLLHDVKDEDKDDDDEFSVEFGGIEEIENMNGDDKALIITDTSSSNFARAKYVVIFDNLTSTEDDLVGIVKKTYTNKLDKTIITLVEDVDDEAKDGVEYILKSGLDANAQWVVYSIEENKDGDWEAKVKYNLVDAMINSGDVHADAMYITKSSGDENSYVSEDGREAIHDGGKLDLDAEATVERYEEALIYIVNVALDEDEANYEVDNYAEVAYEDIKLKELDRLYEFGVVGDTAEVLVIVRGMDVYKANN